MIGDNMLDKKIVLVLIFIVAILSISAVNASENRDNSTDVVVNNEKTDLNVIIGLCVGHDSLFYKYSDALCTTLVTKDKVLAHNPVGALYQTNTYYKKLMKRD